MCIGANQIRFGLLLQIWLIVVQFALWKFVVYNPEDANGSNFAQIKPN